MGAFFGMSQDKRSMTHDDIMERVRRRCADGFDFASLLGQDHSRDDVVEFLINNETCRVRAWDEVKKLSVAQERELTEDQIGQIKKMAGPFYDQLARGMNNQILAEKKAKKKKRQQRR